MTSRRSRPKPGVWRCSSWGRPSPASSMPTMHVRRAGDRACACGCGGEARFAGRRPKTFTTALGPLTLERAWYHCERCHNGFSPRDRALGMEDTFLSPATLRMIGIAAARTSFDGLQRVVARTGRPRCCPQDGGTPRRGARARDRRRRMPRHRTRALRCPHPLPRPRRHRRAGAQDRGPGPLWQAARRQRQDPRGQARRRVVGANHRQGRAPRARPRLRHLQRRHRDHRHPRYRHRARALRQGASCARPNAAASTRHRAGSSSATARRGSGTSPTSTSPTPSRSSTSSTPRAICSRSPRPSTETAARSANAGPGSGARNSTRAASMK